MVTQCEVGYFEILRRASKVWHNASYEAMINMLPGGARNSTLDLLLPVSRNARRNFTLSRGKDADMKGVLVNAHHVT